MEAIPFGSYLLVSRLGKGGMGETWRAVRQDPHGVSKEVALKRILAKLSETPSFVEAFIAEAQVSTQLSHANVAQVFEFGEVEGQYFMAMELVQGRSLHQVLSRLAERGLDGLPPELAIDLTLEVLKGLHHAHTRIGRDGQRLNIVHRDLSPDNVLVSWDGEVKVVDFGIAKASLEGRQETRPGIVKGKPEYFSPEQARGERVDARTDVWAAGVLLYQLLTGRRPVEGEGMQVLERIALGRIESLAKVAPHLDPELIAIVGHALALERVDRYPTALAFHDALAKLLRRIAPEQSPSARGGMMSWLYGNELAGQGRTVVVPRGVQDAFARLQRGPPAPEPSDTKATLDLLPATPVARTTARVRAPKKSSIAWVVGLAALAGAAIVVAAMRSSNHVDVSPAARLELDQRLLMLEADDGASKASAIKGLIEVAAANPDYVEAHAALVMAYVFQLDDLQQQAARLERARSEKNNRVARYNREKSPADWVSRANVLVEQVMKLGDELGALISTEKEVDARFRDAYRKFGDVAQHNRYAAAAAQPEILRAQALYQAYGGSDHALTMLNELHKIDPTDNDQWADFVTAEYTVNTAAQVPPAVFTRALVDLEKLRARDDGFLRLYVLKARVYLTNDDLDRAEEQLDKVLALNPRHEIAAQLKDAIKVKRAERAAKISEAQPQSVPPPAVDVKAEFQRRMGDEIDAVEARLDGRLTNEYRPALENLRHDVNRTEPSEHGEILRRFYEIRARIKDAEP